MLLIKNKFFASKLQLLSFEEIFNQCKKELFVSLSVFLALKLTCNFCVNVRESSKQGSKTLQALVSLLEP
jgi:hypothetical protein